MLACLSSYNTQEFLSGSFMLLQNSGREGYVCVCVCTCDVSQICSINSFPWSTSGWHDWLTGRCPQRAFASCLKCRCQCTVVWAFVQGACGNVCLYIYMAMTECGGKNWEWVWRWSCVKITSVKAPVIYVSVYPCMHGMKKYKTQKAFCCNVQ